MQPTPNPPDRSNPQSFPAGGQDGGFTRSQWGLVFILAAVNFTHMVDFVIIMPLGDRLMRELAITPGQFGHVVAAYAFAAAAAGLLGSPVVNRFDRKHVLLTMYAGFTASTLFCGLAETYEMLLASRILAGVFGGLASATIMAVIGDAFPPQRRGTATGAVMSSFAVASVAGLPIGLLIAGEHGRGAPFVALAGLSVFVWVAAFVGMPAMRGHLAGPKSSMAAEFREVTRNPAHWWAFAFTFSLVLGTFTVASFIGPYLMALNGWKEHDVAVIYLVAGLGTLVGMNVVGRASDKLGKRPVFLVMAGTAMVLCLVVTNLPKTPLWVAAVTMTMFMVFAAGRMVPAQAMLIGVPAPRLRGGFTSLNSAVQNLSTGVAPMIAGAVVVRDADGMLVGYPIVGLIGAASAGVSLLLSRYIRPTTEPAFAPVPPAAVVEPEPLAV